MVQGFLKAFFWIWKFDILAAICSWFHASESIHLPIGGFWKKVMKKTIFVLGWKGPFCLKNAKNIQLWQTTLTKPPSQYWILRCHIHLYLPFGTLSLKFCPLDLTKLPCENVSFRREEGKIDMWYVHIL